VGVTVGTTVVGTLVVDDGVLVEGDGVATTVEGAVGDAEGAVVATGVSAGGAATD
jgi:hypothetical protein